MLFEVDIKPVCVMVISVGGCSVVGHLALYAGQGNPVIGYALVDCNNYSNSPVFT
jgi:hypothetical protein